MNKWDRLGSVVESGDAYSIGWHGRDRRDKIGASAEKEEECGLLFVVLSSC